MPPKILLFLFKTCHIGLKCLFPFSLPKCLVVGLVLLGKVDCVRLPAIGTVMPLCSMAETTQVVMLVLEFMVSVSKASEGQKKQAFESR